MRRGALHYILVGAALGLGVPLVFRLASTALESYAGARDVMWTVFDNVQLMLWPTPLLLVPVEEPGAPDLSSWGAFCGRNIGEYHGIRRARRSYLDGLDEVSFNPGVSLIDSRRCLVCNMAHLVHSNRPPHRDGREASRFGQQSRRARPCVGANVRPRQS